MMRDKLDGLAKFALAVMAMVNGLHTHQIWAPSGCSNGTDFFRINLRNIYITDMHSANVLHCLCCNSHSMKIYALLMRDSPWGIPHKIIDQIINKCCYANFLHVQTSGYPRVNINGSFFRFCPSYSVHQGTFPCLYI